MFRPGRAGLVGEGKVQLIAYGQGPDPGSAVISFVIEPAPEHAGGAIAVVGDFNDWDPTQHEFTPGADGRWRVSVELDTGHRYAFRYLAENGDWFDEPDADDRQENGSGQTDCVLDLTAPRGGSESWTSTASPAPQPPPTLDLDAIRRRVHAATPGPWQRHGCDVWAADGRLLRGRDVDALSRNQADHDAEFVAHARHDVLALLLALDAVRTPGPGLVPAPAEPRRLPARTGDGHPNRVTASPARHQLRELLDTAQAWRRRFRAATD
jgi:hypothetical protein